MNFHPLFLSPLLSFFFFSYLSNIEIIFDFSEVITKIHPPFQNPGSALEHTFKEIKMVMNNHQEDSTAVTEIFKFFGQNADDSGKSTREKILLKVVKARLESNFL